MSCAGTNLVISVCNSNGFEDDNFDILLNGRKLISLNLNSTQCWVGFLISQNRIQGVTFTPTIFNQKNPGALDACCVPLATRVVFSDTALVSGKNTIVMKNTHVNGKGNCGMIKVWKTDISGKVCATLLNEVYHPLSGHDATFTFNW